MRSVRFNMLGFFRTGITTTRNTSVIRGIIIEDPLLKSIYENKLTTMMTMAVSQKIPPRGHKSINGLDFQVKNKRYKERTDVINRTAGISSFLDIAFINTH
jgi:hypothetical protein